jgi:hypothetical protein
MTSMGLLSVKKTMGLLYAFQGDYFEGDGSQIE